MAFRALILTVALLAALLGAASCGGNPDGIRKGDRNEIVFLTMQLRPTFDEYFLNLFAEFEAENPGVKIKWLDYPYQNYETKLMTSFLGWNAPDVINLPSENLPDWLRPGYIVPIDPLVGPEVLESYVPTILADAALYDGEHYAFPWYASSPVTYFNGALLRRAGLSTDRLPRTYNELPAVAKAVKENANAFATFPMYTDQGAFRRMLWEAGVPLTNEEQTAAAFNTPRGVEILTFWTDLYKQGLVPSEALSAAHRRPIELFKTGNLAIMPTGPHFIRQVRADAPDVFENTLVGPYMIWEEEERYMIALHTLAISGQSPNKEMAAKFAAFVTNSENQLAFCKLTTIMPSTIEALQDPFFTTPEDSLEGRARLYSAQHTMNGKVFRPLPEARKLYDVFDSMIERVAVGQLTPEQGLRLAEEQWNVILEQ